MPHFPKPRYRKDRGVWVVEVRKTLHTLGPDKDAAFEAYHRLMADPAVRAESPAVRRGEVPTVTQAGDLYLDHVRATKAPATYATERARVEIACDAFGDRRLDRLEPGEVERWLASGRWSDSTRRAYLRALRSLVRFARRRPTCYGGPDPTAEVPLPKATRRERVLDPEELSRLLAAATPPFREFLEALAVSGARPDALSNLDARSIRWEAGEATVRSKGRSYTLILTDRLRAILGPLAERYPTGPLFRTARGERWTRNSIRLRMARLREKAGVSADVVAYTLRHTFATDALARGESPAVVAEIMGHRDMSMLSRHYAHLARRRGALREAAGRAAGSVPASPVDPGGVTAPGSSG